MPTFTARAKRKTTESPVTACSVLRKGKTLTTVHAKGNVTRIFPPRTDSSKTAADRALTVALGSLEDSKAEDIVTIDIAGKSALADYMIVVSGRSSRHVAAIADHLLTDMKEAGLGNARVEGLETADWVLIDSGDVIIHIFRPEIREFYNIERMWSEPEIEDGTVH
ncbi:ribosome silencing factor [Xaviernesmea oryzae]|uniref:ribosome silencing factor n=1 Tax=Xaviernesmea oryzae TaxID=464029 RepID=UPI0008D3277E|nr:ribosome-associated protein [Xaviernesmea oryzae]